jgi:asparagine N-glycosylation enzyme membrane subunit Stt3
VIRYRDAPMRGTSGASFRVVPSWLVAAGLAALALAVRALPVRRVFVDQDVVPFGNDAWYHLRRIVYSVVRFPAVLDFDRYINHPDGAKPIWTPVFDWSLALLARPFFRPGELTSVERVAVWVPPLLGAATVVVLFRLARRHLDPATALVSALLLCVLPAHFWYSQLGFVDHHAAVALVSAALLAACMDLVAGADEAQPERRFRRGTLRTGLLLGLAILVWPGSLLHVALAQLGLAVYVTTRARREHALLALRSFAASQLVACVLVAPLGSAAQWPQWSEFSPLVLSRFQPWLFGSLALLALLCAALWNVPALGASRGRRLASAAALALAALALLGLAVPELGAGVSEAWRWLARDEAFQAGVNESQPLLLQQGAFSAARALLRLSGFFLLLPLAWPAALVWAWRRQARAPLLFWLGWTLALGAATLAQRRFFNSFSVPFALLVGWCLCEAWRALGRATPGAPRAAARGAVVALALVCLAPTWSTYSGDLVDVLRPAGATRRVPSQLVSQLAAIEMARWLAQRTPPTRGWLDPQLRPEYGVLAPWELGHLLEYAARRPAVVDNFGDDLGAANFEQAMRYWVSAEPTASRILDALGVRYVVLTLAQVVTATPPPDSVLVALALQPAPEPAAPRPGEAPALQRHRLVYESRLWGSEPAANPPLFRIFEHVTGARIRGRAAPGAPVEVRLALRSGRPRELWYRARARADAAGRFSLRVPYATQGAPRGVRVAGAYTLVCGGVESAVVVPEAAVRDGLEVAAPPPCAPEGEAR